MSVISQATAASNADTIKNETGAGLNTATRVGQMFRDLVDSLSWTVFGPSGTGHSTGLVPDPGGSVGTAKFLCEDGTWKPPASSFLAPADPGENNRIAYASSGLNAWASAVKTDGTYLSVGASPATSGLYRFPHNPGVAILAGLGADGTTVFQVLQWGSGANNKIQIGSTTVPFLEAKAIGLSFSASAQNATANVGFTVTGGAHTALTASTEVTEAVFNLAQTKQWATGALATQRAMRILAPTLAFVGDSTVTLGATLAISGPPIAGTHCLAITKALALWLESGSLGFGTGAMPASGLNRLGYVSQASGGIKIFTGFLDDGTTEVTLQQWNATQNVYEIGSNSAAGTNVKASAIGSHSWVFNAVTKMALDTNKLDLKTLYQLFSSQSAPSAPGSTDVAVFNNGGILRIISAARTVIVDGPNVSRGPDLTNSDQTVVITDGNARFIPKATRTATHNTILSTAGATAGDTWYFHCEDTTPFTKTFTNGGPSGGVETIAGSTAITYVFVFDNTDWHLSNRIGLMLS